MLIFTKSLRVLLATEPIDFRSGLDRLHSLIKDYLHDDPLSSQVYVFINKRRTHIRLFYWDGTGLWLMTKRLEQGTYHWPRVEPGTKSLTMKSELLDLLLSGIDLTTTQMRRWYEVPEAA